MQYYTAVYIPFLAAGEGALPCLINYTLVAAGEGALPPN